MLDSRMVAHAVHERRSNGGAVLCDGAYEAMTFERKACANIWKLLPDATGVPSPTAVPILEVVNRGLVWLHEDSEGKQ